MARKQKRSDKWHVPLSIEKTAEKIFARRRDELWSQTGKTLKSQVAFCEFREHIGRLVCVPVSFEYQVDVCYADKEWNATTTCDSLPISYFKRDKHTTHSHTKVIAQTTRVQLALFLCGFVCSFTFRCGARFLITLDDAERNIKSMFDVIFKRALV